MQMTETESGHDLGGPQEVPNLWRAADETLDRSGPGKTSFVLGIVGDSGSGKNTVADSVRELVGSERVTEVRLDDYHRFTREERAAQGVTPLNPIVHNLALMQEHLRLLRQGRPIRNRSYSHSNGTFGPIRTIEPNDIVIVTGLLGFPTRELQNLYDLAVFLQPEPDLLFRWKLRRDVLFRGYKEADVLKSIARHLLDAKEFVLPQAERAHVLVHYDLPHWEAPDTEVSTTIRMRREAADFARDGSLFAYLSVDQAEEDGEVVVRIPANLSSERVDEWGRQCIPEGYDPANTGKYFDESGCPQRRATLAVVEILIAHLAGRMASGLTRSIP
jgi:phosphoribulokinase